MTSYDINNYIAPEFDSPIEFTIVGPYQGRDAVLARSRGAGIDLIGIATLGDFRLSADILASFFLQSRQINSIRSSKLLDLDPSKDSRSSDLVFSWVGSVSEMDFNRIKDTFMIQAAEIIYSARDGDVQSLEMAIAPIVLRCSMSHEKKLKSRRLLVATFFLYVTMGILGAGFAGFAFASKYILYK